MKPGSPVGCNCRFNPCLWRESTPSLTFIMMNSEKIFRRNLEFWTLFQEGDLRIGELASNRGLWVSFRTVHSPPYLGTTHFDLNILRTKTQDSNELDSNLKDSILYLLYLEIESRHLGKGFGSDLYRRLENAAKDLGCCRVEQTPSGSTFTGETRSSYLQRRGYTLQNGVATKELGSVAQR